MAKLNRKHRQRPEPTKRTKTKLTTALVSFAAVGKMGKIRCSLLPSSEQTVEVTKVLKYNSKKICGQMRCMFFLNSENIQYIHSVRSVEPDAKIAS